MKTIFSLTKRNMKVLLTSNVAEANSVEIVETAAIKGASGSAVIGTITGETVTANNNPLPQQIDLNAPKANTNKSIRLTSGMAVNRSEYPT